MMKKLNNSGFGAVEVILLVVVVALVGFVGWTVYKNRPKAAPVDNSSSAPQTQQTKAPDPYAGWQTATLKNEKVTFKYPKDWQLVDNSVGTSGDHIELKGTNGFDMSIEAMPQLGALGSDSPTNIVYTQSATMLGQAVYLDFIESLLTPTKVGHIDVSTSATDAYKVLPAKNVAPKDGIFVIGMSYSDASGNIPKQLDEVKNDQNYKDALLVLKSMHY